MILIAKSGPSQLAAILLVLSVTYVVGAHDSGSHSFIANEILDQVVQHNELQAIYLTDFFFGQFDSLSLNTTLDSEGTLPIDLPDNVVIMPPRSRCVSTYSFWDSTHLTNFPEAAMIWRDSSHGTLHMFSISRNYTLDVYLLPLGDPKGKVERTHSHDMRHFLFKHVGDYPVCGRMRSLGPNKIIFICSQIRHTYSYLHVVVVTFREIIDPLFIDLKAPFKVENIADEIIDVYGQNATSFYLLRSSVMMDHQMQVYYADEGLNELIFVANFTQHELNSSAVYVNVTLPMKIHDIRIFNGSIAIADFQNGLVIMDISFKESFILDTYTIYCVMKDLDGISHIYIENKWESETMLLSKELPPIVFEVDVSDIRNPVYLSTFSIPGDYGRYEGTAFITSNENYLVMMVYSSEDAHPFLFIFQRRGDYMDKKGQKVALSRQQYSHDILSFLDRFDNTFVLSSVFALHIYNVTDAKILINGFSKHFPKLIGTEFYVTLYVKGFKGQLFNQTFKVFPIHSDYQLTLRINTNATRDVVYRIGDDSFVYNVGQFFSGPRRKLELESSKPED